MSLLNLRKRPRVCYYEPEEPPFDEYVFCSECRDYVYEYCSIHGPLLIIPDEKVRASACSAHSPSRRTCVSARTAEPAPPAPATPTMLGRSTTKTTNLRT